MKRMLALLCAAMLLCAAALAETATDLNDEAEPPVLPEFTLPAEATIPIFTVESDDMFGTEEEAIAMAKAWWQSSYLNQDISGIEPWHAYRPDEHTWSWWVIAGSDPDHQLFMELRGDGLIRGFSNGLADLPGKDEWAEDGAISMGSRLEGVCKYLRSFYAHTVGGFDAVEGFTYIGARHSVSADGTDNWYLVFSDPWIYGEEGIVLRTEVQVLPVVRVVMMIEREAGWPDTEESPFG